MLVSAENIEQPNMLVEAEQMMMLAQSAGAETAMAILTAFKNSNAEILNDLGNHAQSMNYDEVAKSAHALKGSAGNLGATALAEQARLVEVACKNKDADQLAVLLEALPATIDETAFALEAIIASA